MGKVLNVVAAAAILSAYTTAFAMDAMHKTTGKNQVRRPDEPCHHIG